MNHTEYPANLKSKCWEALCFIAKDAREAAEAQPEGENVGYYLDENNYCANEMSIRKNLNSFGAR